MPVVPAGALPIYLQVSEILIRDIAAGRLADGERLPPERKMAADLGLAVGTLRKALADLEQKGLLQRIQGSGNYIRVQESPESIYAFFRLERIEGGGLPTAQALSVDRRPKPPCLPAFGIAAEGYRIRRLRQISGIPAALEEIWLDAALCDTLTVADITDSLYRFYRSRLNLFIARADDRIGLDTVPEWAPPMFPLAPGSAVPLVTRMAWDRQGRSVEASLTWFNPATTRYVARLK